MNKNLFGGMSARTKRVIFIVLAFVFTMSAAINFSYATDTEAEGEAQKIDISNAAVSGIVNKTYNGSAQTQTITVKLGEKTLTLGTDYRLEYSGNVKVGKAKLTITAIGDTYTGKIEKQFDIVSRHKIRVTISDRDITFKKSVLYDAHLAKNTLPSSLVLTAQKNSMKLSWKAAANLKDIDGYIVLRKTGKNTRYYQVATVKKSATTYVDKSAKKKNTYYVYVLVGYKKNGDKIAVSQATTAWVGGVTTRSSKKNLGTPKIKTKEIKSLAVGKTKKLEIKFPSRIYSKKIRWSSGNTAIATVDSNGKVTAKGAGTTYIYAKSATGRSAKYKITVPAPPKPKKILKGIDVSEWNDKIDWAKVKNDGVDFAIVRVGGRFGGSGKLYYDSEFDRNMQEANRLGIPVGVYFFTQAINEKEAREEAEYAVKYAKKYKVSYPIVYDTESLKIGNEVGRHNKISKATRTKCAKAFCDRVRELGYTPMIYASTCWLEDDLDMTKLQGIEVWVAQYYKVCEYEGAYKCWQYTSLGKVAGIKGYVDLNYWYNP